MAPQHKKWIPWLIFRAKLFVVSLLCWFIYREFISGNETLSTHTWHVEPGWLVLSGVLYLLGLVPFAVFWQRVCLRAGKTSHWVNRSGLTTFRSWASMCPANGS